MLLTAIVSLFGFVSRRFQRALVLSPFLVKRGQIHRLLTAGIVHKDLAHLGANMLVLWFFSRRVLATFGAARYLALYVSAIVAAYLLTTLRFRNDRRYSSLGASGAVAAVMFSAIMLDPLWTLRLMFVPVPIPGVVLGALYIAYSVLHSWSARDRINHDAHFTGALYGAAFTYLFAPAKVLLSITVLRRFFGY
jgi:membrane associated rhomboid family serine protease